MISRRRHESASAPFLTSPRVLNVYQRRCNLLLYVSPRFSDELHGTALLLKWVCPCQQPCTCAPLAMHLGVRLPSAAL